MEIFFISVKSHIKRNPYEACIIHVKYRNKIQIKGTFCYPLLYYYNVFLDSASILQVLYIAITKLCSRESGCKLIMEIVPKLHAALLTQKDHVAIRVRYSIKIKYYVRLTINIADLNYFFFTRSFFT